MSHLHSLLAELVCTWLQGPESVWGKRLEEADRHLVETLSLPQTYRKSLLWAKVLPGLTNDFCRIRKFWNINLDSLVLVKPQTSQILKVSGELDEGTNFKQENKNPWDLF